MRSETENEFFLEALFDTATDDVVEKLGGALDDVEVALREGIETARVDRDSAHDRSITGAAPCQRACGDRSLRG